MPDQLSPRRARTRQRKESAIIDVAMQLVEKDGIEAVTVARIAHAMDWSLGTMYRYFPSKDVLMGVLHARVLHDYRHALEAHLSTATAVPIDQLIRLVRYSVQWFSDRPDHWALIGMGLAHPQPLINDTAAVPMITEALNVVRLVVTPIEHAVQQGQLEDGDGPTRALVLWAHVQGVLQMRKLTRFPSMDLELHNVLDAGLQAILIGWGADGQALNTYLQQETA